MGFHLTHSAVEKGPHMNLSGALQKKDLKFIHIELSHLNSLNKLFSWQQRNNEGYGKKSHGIGSTNTSAERNCNFDSLQIPSSEAKCVLLFWY